MSNLKKYENLSFIYKKAHSKAVNYYTSRNIVLNVINISIVSLTGVANNITSITDIENKILSVCYSIILYFSVVLSTLNQFLKYEELAEKHRVASIRYNHLFNLCLLSKESDLETIIEEYENIYNSAPNIPENLKQIDTDTDFDIEMDTRNRIQIKEEDNIDLATTYQINRMIIQSYKT